MLSPKVVLLVALGLALADPLATSAQSLPPGPTFPMQSTFDAASPSGDYELVQLVLDFPPGAWTPRHTHGGQVFVTVLSGQVTVRGEGAEQTYGPGSHWVESPGEYHAAGNNTGENVRLVGAFLLPKGAALTTVEQGESSDDLPPGPTLVYQTRTEGIAERGALDVVQLVGDFAAGAWTPLHEHGGRGAVTVLEGTMAVRDAAGERRFTPGQSWVEGQGEVAAVGNPGDSAARLVASFALPDGATLTTIRDSTTQMPTSLPKTGAGDHGPWLLLVVAVLIMTAGLALRSRTA